MLQKLFGTTKPAIVWTWIVGVGLLAAQEASSRVEYTYDKLGRHMTISVLTSGLGILCREYIAVHWCPDCHGFISVSA